MWLGEWAVRKFSMSLKMLYKIHCKIKFFDFN